MEPKYTAQKSGWACCSPLWLLSCLLILPIIVLIFRIIAVKKYSLKFYDNKVVIRRGWFNVREDEMTFMGVTAVSIEKSFWGSLCGYGTVKIDCVGQHWDIESTSYIKNPEGLKKYLQSRMVAAPRQNQFVQM